MTKFQKENILISVAGKERKSPNPSVAQGRNAKYTITITIVLKVPLGI